MKVRITMTLDINEERWADEYDICVHEVRDDVKEYINATIAQHPVLSEMLNESV